MTKKRNTIKIFELIILVLFTINSFAQVKLDSLLQSLDTTKRYNLNEIVISASRVSETILRSPVSIEQLKSFDAKNMGAATVFDAIENMKGIQIITPSLGFKVINARGFSNTTNVRFAQMVDGMDNQAPHIGAPIANAFGANDLDIDKVEIIPGTSSALYGMNAINGLANIRTKNPFTYQGFSFQQLTGVNHVGQIDNVSPQVFSQTNLRYGKALNSKFAFKVNGSYTNGNDWVADDKTDLAPQLNASVGLTGAENPAFDETNRYGDESSNRKTLTLNGKKYSVARTGYEETNIADYNILNYKGDIGLYFRPKESHEFSFSYKGALINTVYHRNNRFRLQDYALQQYALEYQSPVFQVRSYLTLENTGKSYNMRSLAENMDKAFKSDNKWFSDYTIAYNNAITQGEGIADAHRLARLTSDGGRYQPGTGAYNEKKEAILANDNWDYGAALRVQSRMSHTEALLSWDKLFPSLFEKAEIQLLSGIDSRTYIVLPYGHYMVNPIDTTQSLIFTKSGGFTQLNKDLFDKKLRLSATIRADKADYFTTKYNPRFTMVYSTKESINIRTSYQSGYRFPSLFEAFSNFKSGGVKRIGGVKIMSEKEGVFENSYTKTSIDAFQTQVNSDINTSGLTQAQAIDKNKGMLKKTPYTYIQPEYIRSFEIGFRGLALNNSLYIDVDFYYNSYENLIGQTEASIPLTSYPDSIPKYLYDKTKQDRYRLFTNSKSKMYNYGSSFGIKYKYDEKLSILGNFTYAELDRIEDKDGLEDGFNTPQIMVNGTVITENIWKNMGASITGRYQTKFDYVSFLASGEVPAYWTLDAQVNYNFKKAGILAKLGASNLLNKLYNSILAGSSVGGLYYLSLTWAINKK
ncbi:MAG: TonB-dependent receptor [Bacteroidota bacterium]